MADASLDPHQEERRNKTRWLMIAGAASLLLPLAGAAYLHWNDVNGGQGANMRGDMFESHEGRGPIVPSQAVSAGPVPAASGKAVSSLDFIKAGDEFKTSAAAPNASTATAPAALPAGAPADAAAAAPAAGAKKAAAGGKKPFVMPKLQTGRGFKSWMPPSSGTTQAPAAPAGAAQNPQQMLQNLPPGAANNPDVQKYLQQQQQH